MEQHAIREIFTSEKGEGSGGGGGGREREREKIIMKRKIRRSTEKSGQ